MIRLAKNIITQMFLMVKSAAKVLFAILAAVFAVLFGQVNWRAPLWLRKVAQVLRPPALWCRKHNKATGIGVLVVIVLVAVGLYVQHWYASQPKPYMVAYRVDVPTLSDSGLVIRFRDSVAPLAMINQPVTEGITISAPVAGEWHWANDRTLAFKPQSKTWPIDQTYKVSLDEKNLLTQGALLEKYQFEFTTPRFEIRNFSASLYHDPLDPGQKKVVSTLTFTHPLDRPLFEKLISFELSKGLQYAADAPSMAPEFYYSNDGREAYVHSPLLQTPLETSKVKLFLDKGVGAQAGGNKTQDAYGTEVSIPGLYQLSFSSNSIFFADNDKGEPEPILSFESNHPVTDEAIKNRVTAWLLPNKNKGSDWRLETVTESVLASSEKVVLEQIESDNPQNSMHAFKFRVPPGRQVYVQIDAGIRSTSGYIAREATAFIRKMPNYPQALSFLSNGALLNLTGEQDLGIIARGIPGAKVEVARILPRQLHLLVNQLDGNFTRPHMSDSALDQLVERAQIAVPIAADDPAKTIYTHVNLGKYLNAADTPQGIFVLQLGVFNPQNRKASDPLYSGDVRDTRFIVVTDLGIIAKKTADNSHEVFIQSIGSGLPVAQARVEVYGANGLPVVAALTDENGRVHFDNLDSLTREKRPLMYVVTKDSDMSFLPIASSARQLNYSRFPVEGITENSQPNQLSAYLFSDRGLYRPGETAHIASLVRSADWDRSLAGVPVRLTISDPRGRVVQTNNFNLSKTAFNSVDFTSGVNAPAGTYTAQLYLMGPRGEGGRFLSSMTFSVRDFEPDRMKVTLELSEKSHAGWLKPEQVDARLLAMQLFGAPAGERRVTGEMNVTPAYIAFNGYQDYRFYLAKALDESFYQDLPETRTDVDGNATLSIRLDQFVASAYNLYVMASVYEAEGGRNVKAQSRVMVSDADYLIGVKAQDALDFINKGAVRQLHWLALGQDLTPVSVADLTIELVEVRYISVLVKQNDGTYRYQSRRKDLIVEKQPLTLAETGFEQTLRTDEPGNYLVNIRRGEELLNQVAYMVAGNANTSRALDRNAELQLDLNKTTFAPGEEIEISIRAPYTGAGLITIERDKVYNHVWFLTNTTSSVQRIRVPEELEGNAYINVQFVRGIDSEEIYMSPLSYGVVPFNISLDKRRMGLELETPELVEPGDVVPITVKLTAPGNVVVYGVDEGILQVARYKQPKPLEYFFRKRALEVSTMQILDLILPEFSLMMRQAAAGGDDEGALAANLNPFKRKNKPPVVWWSGITELPAGTTTLEWEVPDYFNGQLHFFAVAVDEQTVGVSQTYTAVRGPIVLTPNVPTFVTPGDVVKVTTGIFNNLPEAAELKVFLETSEGLQPLMAEPLLLTVNSMREGVATFDLVAREALGSADVVFVAELPDGKQVRISEAISVRPAVQYRVQLALGTFTKKEFELTPQRTLYPQLRNVQAGVGSSPLVWAAGLQTYLDNYAYSCTEQLLSKAMPALVWGSAANEADVQQFNRAVSILRQRQNSSGGFGIWDATPQSSTFVSLYAADFLLEAQERGFNVDKGLLDYVNNFLGRVANDSATQGFAELRNRTYAIYLLTRQGMVTSNLLSSVRERFDTYYEDETWQTDIAGAYMAATYKLLRLDKEAEALIKKQPWLALSKNWRTYDEYFDPLTHDAQYLNLLIKHFPERFKTIPLDLLVNLGLHLEQERYNSLSAALLVRALDNYGQMAQERIDVSTTAHYEDETTALLEMLGKPPRADLPIGLARLIFNKNDTRTAAFYLLTEAGYDLHAPAQAITQGLEVIHDYLNLAGEQVTQVGVGDEFLVRIRIRTTNSQTYYNVAVVDLLPGGVEPVYNQPPTGQTDEDYYDEDEDDDYYEDEYESYWQPVGEEEFSDWRPDFIDPRDDRVVLYGTCTPDVRTFTYRVRATNAGKFVTSPAFAQSMYQPKIVGQSMAGQLEIVTVDEAAETAVDSAPVIAQP